MCQQGTTANGLDSVSPHYSRTHYHISNSVHRLIVPSSFVNMTLSYGMVEFNVPLDTL